MGMFDIISAELECPETKKSEKQEIQIKWRKFRSLDHFAVGSSIDDVWPEYDNNWIKADYVCKSCSKKTKGEYGPFIKIDDQKRHYCFVKMEKGRIRSILDEKDFAKLGIEKYVIYD